MIVCWQTCIRVGSRSLDDGCLLPADAIALLSEEITLLAVRNGWARWMTDLQGSIEGQSMQCRIEYPLDDAPGTTELLKGPSWRTLNVQIEASLS